MGQGGDPFGVARRIVVGAGALAGQEQGNGQDRGWTGPGQGQGHLEEELNLDLIYQSLAIGSRAASSPAL